MLFLDVIKMSDLATLQIFYFFAILGLILVIARALGFVGNRFFGLPTVLGEIVTGIIIGPYALGYFIFPKNGIFSPLTSEIPVPSTIYMFGQVGIVILLFYIGLESDVEKFIKGTLYGIVGGLSEALFTFTLITLFVYWYSKNFLVSLMMGAILVSTSTSITTRILKDLNKLNSKEGMGILLISIYDDFIGITIFIVVTNLILSELNLLSILTVIIEIIIFLIVFLLVGSKGYGLISKLLGFFKHRETRFAIILTILFLLTTLTIQLGLTLLLGSFLFGMSLSKIKQKDEIVEDLKGLYNFFVPIFFVTVGMMMNLNYIFSGIVLAIIILIGAYIGKVFGAAIPSMHMGFTVKESFRIGNGLVPFADVPVVVASTAYVQGFISQQLYSVVILIVLITTLIGPILYVWLLRSGENEGNGIKENVHTEDNRK